MEFKKIANELMFDLTKEEEDYIEIKYNSFNENIKKIKVFDLNKYQNDLHETTTLQNGVLRDDNECEKINDQNVFQNVFSFEDNYVKVKNDK